MQYSYWIETSQTWTCPKTGAWKIICVGGGASGGAVAIEHFGTATIKRTPFQATGGTTSFGSYLSAAGGQRGMQYTSDPNSVYSGYNGYTGVANNLYGTQLQFSGMNYVSIGFPGVGYGAGGSSKQKNISSSGFTVSNSETSATLYGVPGFMGKIKTIITDITQNTNVACTIGKGGLVSSLTSAMAINAANINGAIPTAVTSQALEYLKSYLTDGTDGLICLEYMD